MSTIDKRATAVVLYDIQNETMKKRDDPAHRKAIETSGLVPNLVGLVSGVRPYRIPIMWIHTARRADRADVAENLVDEGRWAVLDDWASALIDEMIVAPEDHTIGKLRRDPFIGTNLDLQLRTRKIDTIVLGGYATNWGVESTARTAYDLGYHVVLLSDCCFNVQVDQHEFSIKNIMPRLSRVMTAKQALGLIQ